MKVQNMISSRGNAVPNQFIITGEHYGQQGQFFQSYDSVIAFVPSNGNIPTLDCNKWDYSPTTSKYRNQFLGETTKETQAKIDRGEYILADLNNV
jgi:hypothetical protein